MQQNVARWMWYTLDADLLSSVASHLSTAEASRFFRAHKTHRPDSIVKWLSPAAVQATTPICWNSKEYPEMLLHIATRYDANFLDTMLLAQAIPQALTMQDHNGDIPAHTIFCRFKDKFDPGTAQHLIRLCTVEGLLVQDKQNQTLIHIAMQEQMPGDTVQLLAQTQPRALVIEDENMENPLFNAIRYNYGPDVIREIVMLAPDATDGMNRWQETPISMAVRLHRAMSIIQLTSGGFFESSANAAPCAHQLLSKQNEWGQTPLHLVEDLEVLRILIPLAPEVLTIPDNDGRTPLLFAIVESKKIEVIEYLALACPATVVTMHRPRAEMPLHQAVMRNNYEAVKCLLRANTAAAMRQDRAGRTALFIALNICNIHTCSALEPGGRLQHCPPDCSGRNPSHVCAEIISLLRKSSV